MKKTAVVLMGALFVTALAFNADALTINLAQGDEYYLGLVVDGNPASPTDEVKYINYLKTLAAGAGPTLWDGEEYSRVGSTLNMTGAEDAVPDGYFKTTDAQVPDPLPPDWTVPLSSPYLYILAKYDAEQAGSLVWYLGGAFGGLSEGDIVTYDVPDTLNGLGLSHVSAYNPNSVPDGGGTLVLLGCAFGVLGMLKRLV